MRALAAYGAVKPMIVLAVLAYLSGGGLAMDWCRVLQGSTVDSFINRNAMPLANLFEFFPATGVGLKGTQTERKQHEPRRNRL